MYVQKREKFTSVEDIMAYHRIPLGQCQESVNTREWLPCMDRGCPVLSRLWTWCVDWRVVL